jgi:hypothetical protein
MSHRDSPIKKNKELFKPMDIMNVGFVGAAGGGGWDYDDDFSTDKGWTSVGTGNQIDTGNSTLDFQTTRGNTFLGSYIPTNDADVFGANFSDTAFIIRFHALNYSSLNSSYGYSPFLQAQRDGGDGSEDNDDTLSAWCLVSTQYTHRFGAMANDNAARTSNNSDATTWATGTDYFIETIRNSATEMKSTRSTTDSFDADEHEQILTIPSTITGLKNITIQSDHAGSMSSKTNIGTINQIQAMKEVNTAP